MDFTCFKKKPWSAYVYMNLFVRFYMQSHQRKWICHYSSFTICRWDKSEHFYKLKCQNERALICSEEFWMLPFGGAYLKPAYENTFLLSSVVMVLILLYVKSYINSIIRGREGAVTHLMVLTSLFLSYLACTGNMKLFTQCRKWMIDSATIAMIETWRLPASHRMYADRKIV